MTYTAVRLYARFSNLEQKEGMSIERQRRDINALFREMGLIPTSEIIDQGRSAYHGSHRSVGELGKYEAEALAGEHQGELLAVERIDRLSRAGHDDTYRFITGLTSAGVTIATVDGRELYRAYEKLELIQVITMLIKAELAHEESVKKADRSRTNWLLRFEKAMREGTPLGRNCPPWLEIHEGGYRVIPARNGRPDYGALVARIFTMADAGAGAGKIVKILNRQGVPYWSKPRKEGKRPAATIWHRSKVIELLTNRAVIGEATSPDGDTFMLYPPVVPADVFERVSGNAGARKAERGGARSEKIVNLLGGVCRCENCHGTFGYTGKGYLKCSKAEAGACHNRASVSYNALEKAVLDACLHLALDDNAFSNKAEVSRLNVTIAQRKRELELAVTQAENLMRLAGDKGSEMAERIAMEAEDRAKGIRAKLDALTAQREAAKGRAGNQEHLRRVADIRNKIYDPDLEVRIPLRLKVAQALKTLVTRVWFDDEGLATVALAGGLAAFQVRDGVITDQANALSAFQDGDFSRLVARDDIDRKNIPDVARRLGDTLVSRGMMKKAG